MFENHSNQSETQGWEVRLRLLKAMVIELLLYGVEMWGDGISRSAWNETEKIQKNVLTYNNWGQNTRHHILSFY